MPIIQVATGKAIGSSVGFGLAIKAVEPGIGLEMMYSFIIIACSLNCIL